MTDLFSTSRDELVACLVERREAADLKWMAWTTAALSAHETKRRHEATVRQVEQVVDEVFASGLVKFVERET